MNITIAELINATQVFNKLMNKELSPITSFKIAKLVKSINSEIEVFEKERVKLLEKYGTKDEDNSYKISEGNKENWSKDITALLTLNVDISDEKINLSNEGIKISPADMLLIEKFIEIL